MESNKKELKLEETELRLGLPGSDSHQNQLKPCNATKNNKRAFADINDETASVVSPEQEVAPVAKVQVIGWPPIRSYRKNTIQAKKTEVEEGGSGMYVKVSMDGAPYLRKIDLRLYSGYAQFLKAVQDMFKLKVGSGHVPTYEDKDGDWMLIGDVPWEMFTTSCKRLRIMKRSDANGMGCMA